VDVDVEDTLFHATVVKAFTGRIVDETAWDATATEACPAAA
jgi:hypothetical protein